MEETPTSKVRIGRTLAEITMTPTPFLRGLLNSLRRIPFSASLALAIILSGVIAGTLSSGPHHHSQPIWGAGVPSTVEHGRIWTVLTALLIPRGPLSMVLDVLLAIFVLGLAERMLGTARTAWIWLVSGSAGILLGLGLQLAGGSLGESWAEFSHRNVVLDPVIGMIGPVLAASAVAPALWRRRIRLLAFAVLLTFLLYNGDASTMYRTLSALTGLVIGLALPGRPRHTLRTPSSHRETRTLIAGVMALTALGPILGLIRHDGDSPFSAITLLVRREHAIVLILLAVLLVSYGLSRGKLWGYLGALLLNTTIVVFGLSRINYSSLLGDENLEPRMIEMLIWNIALVIIPLLLIIALIALRHRLLSPDVMRHGSSASERAKVRELLRRHGGTMSYLTTWAGNNYWFGPDDASFVAYRVINGIAITTGDPVASPEHRAETVRAFAAFCDRANWVPVFYSASSELLPLMEDLGWARMSVGEETIVHTKGLDFSGSAWANVRNGLRRGEREGLRALWTRWADLSLAQRSQILAISEQWVAEKALPEMGFTLGTISELDDPEVRLMLVVDPSDRIQAVTSWLPSWQDGQLVAWTNDFMRRADNAHPRVMEFVIAQVAIRCAEDGVDVMGLSGAPLAGKPDGLPADADEPESFAKLREFLSNALEPVYGFRALFAFKSKFNPEYRTLWLFISDPLFLPSAGIAIARAYLPGISARQALRLARTLS